MKSTSSRRARAIHRLKPVVDLILKERTVGCHCAREISRVGRYRFDSRLLAQPGRVFDVEPGERDRPGSPRVAYRGEDLASVLYFLSETKSPMLQEIIDRIAEAIQGFERFEFNRVLCQNSALLK